VKLAEWQAVFARISTDASGRWLGTDPTDPTDPLTPREPLVRVPVDR